MLRRLLMSLALLATTATASQAGFNSIGTVTGSSIITGVGTRSASAQFFEGTGADAGAIKITLKNLGNYDAMVPTDMLTGLYFNGTGTGLSINKPSSSTKGKVLLSAGSKVYLNGSVKSVPGDDVSTEYAFKQSFSVSSTTYQNGISSSGMGVFGKFDRFNQTGNLSGTDAPGGLEYAITTDKDKSSTFNGGVKDNEIIQNAVDIILYKTGGVFNLNNITSVRFQYGTAFYEPSITVTKTDNPGGFSGFGTPVATPAPSALLLSLLGVPAFALLRRRRVGAISVE